jgi:oligopeptide transport system substrate-binding protein
MPKIIIPFVALLAAVVTAMVLDRPAPRADVVVAQVSDCFTLDPQRMSYMQDLRMARSLYEGLVRIDGRTGEIMPAAAESWTCSEDGRTWTFQIRPDARWSNGDPVTANDFVYAWRRAIMPDTAADYSGFFNGIKGVPEFFTWRATTTGEYASGEAHSPEAAGALLEEADRRFEDTVGVKALDDRTLQVTLSEPIPYFLDLCAFAVLSPVHRPTVERYVTLNPRTGLLEQEHGWTKAGVHVGNGPRILEPDDGCCRHRRSSVHPGPEYHRAGLPGGNDRLGDRSAGRIPGGHVQSGKGLSGQPFGSPGSLARARAGPRRGTGQSS